eukprot:600315-Alexandrium_andersonii.AAC.1
MQPLPHRCGDRTLALQQRWGRTVAQQGGPRRPARLVAWHTTALQGPRNDKCSLPSAKRALNLA